MQNPIPGDKNVYYLSFHAAESTLIAEKQYFDARASNAALSMSDRAEAVAISARISNALLVLRSQLDAFISSYEAPGLPPPSAALIAKSKKLTDELPKALLAANTAQKVVRIVTSFIGLWAKLLT
jgi:hypothetical protein